MPGRSEKDQRKPQAVLGRVMSRQMCCVMHCPAVQLLMCVMKPHRHRFLHVWQVGNVEMTEQEIEEFREVFDLVDKDKGGAIEADEVGVCLMAELPALALECRRRCHGLSC